LFYRQDKTFHNPDLIG